MQGLFIHDHRFPRLNEKYYYSYGFDAEFFKRYEDIFGKIAVIGREKEIELNPSLEGEIISSDISFYTIKELKELKYKSVREQLNNKIQSSDFLVIRVPSILGIYAAYKAKQMKKPYIIEVVGCYWDGIMNKGKRKIIEASILTSLMKSVIRSAKYVVYVTEEFLEKRYPTKGKYIACSNVTLNSVTEEDLEKRLKHIESRKDKLVLGTCATVDVVYKGQQDVIKALAKLKKIGYDIEYQLVGGGDTSYLESIAKEYGVSDQVKFIGTLQHSKVFNWLETIDIYIHPSKQEGLSRAIIEAMSKACPITGADAGGIHELIDDTYIFGKGNVNEICEILKGFDKKTMIEQAIQNHQNSKRYLKNILYNRRKEFFRNFIEANN